jgi:hypothetical protein
MFTHKIPAAAVLAATLVMAACSGTREVSTPDARTPVEVPVQVTRLEPEVQPFEAGGGGRGPAPPPPGTRGN